MLQMKIQPYYRAVARLFFWIMFATPFDQFVPPIKGLVF